MRTEKQLQELSEKGLSFSWQFLAFGCGMMFMSNRLFSAAVEKKREMVEMMKDISKGSQVI